MGVRLVKRGGGGHNGSGSMVIKRPDYGFGTFTRDEGTTSERLSKRCITDPTRKLSV